MFLQTPTFIPNDEIEELGVVQQVQPVWPWVAAGLLLLAVGLATFFWLRNRSRRHHSIPRALEYVVLLVMVPKDVEQAEHDRRDWQAILASFETLFVTLSGAGSHSGKFSFREWWQTFWYGRHDHLAFEIVAHHEQIYFYLSVPRQVQQLVELQIQAQYPRAHIEPVRDYNIFSADSKHVGAVLRLTQSTYYPIRTYRNLDGDPLNAITNVLSKVQPGEGAAVQILIRPASHSWGNQARQMARRMQEGKRSGQANSSGNFLTASLRSSGNQLESGTVPSLTPLDQQRIMALEEKASKPAFQTCIRVVTAAKSTEQARMLFDNVMHAFGQFHGLESGTEFRPRSIVATGDLFTDFIYRRFDQRTGVVLNTEELNSLYHFPLPQTETPNIVWLSSKKSGAPVSLPTEGVILGHNKYRNEDRTVRLAPVDRRRHTYIIGVTGSGKSVLMANMARQDITAGHGVCIIDPHGNLVEDILAGIPAERMHDVIIFDPSDTERPVGLNMLEARTPEERDAAVQEMIAIFMKLFPPEVIGPMFEHNMRNAMLTLMEDEEQPGTIADIPRMFTDKAFQQYKVSKVKDPVVRSFWEKEMAKTSDFHKSEMLGYLISKVGRFVENSMMRNIIGQQKSGFNFREIMDNRKILLVNLSKGKVGEVNAALLGLIIVAKIQMAALSRADVPEDQRNDFYLYIDEFQNFITDSIAIILSEARKYKLNLIMAHQYMGQLSQGADTRVRDAVLGNVGTMIAFRIGVEDADVLAKQFAPTFTAYDLVNQDRFTAYIKLLVNNTVVTPFHMETNQLDPGQPRVAEAIRQYSRLRYGLDRPVIEASILARTQLGSTATVPTAATPGEQLR